MGICMIFGAGERVTADRVMIPAADDLVIAADGGLVWLSELTDIAATFRPVLFIGDFDSFLDREEERGFNRDSVAKLCETFGTELIPLPVVKDDTDTGAAVAEGRKRGYQTFQIYGGTGGRWDHTIANCQLLANIARNGGRGFLVGAGLCAVAIHEETVRICGKPGTGFSVFSAGGTVEGVTIRGAKYELDGAPLSDDYALGVSNSFSASPAEIGCKKGTLLIVGEFLPNDCE